MGLTCIYFAIVLLRVFQELWPFFVLKLNAIYITFVCEAASMADDEFPRHGRH